MNRRRTALLAAVALALGAGVIVTSGTASDVVATHPTWDVAAERTLRDADIRFYQRRAQADPTGALDELRLAALYLQRARERGTPADLDLAEAAARRSLANRRAHNTEAFRALSLALIGQHRFAEAREAAESLLAADPSAAGARSLVGEIALELGNYRAADAIFRALDQAGTDPAVTARTARWASVRGHSAHARTLLLRAKDDARSRFGTPAEQVAWFDLRLGELALSVGAFNDAARHLDAARTIVPDDPRTMLGLARLALARGDAAEALVQATAAMNVGEDPLAFALASDAHRRLGEAAQSDRYFRAFETAIAAAPPSAWHRQWRLALLDRDRQVGEVLAQATADLERRRDVYGWDLYAWALHRAGRDPEARVAMRHALRWNTEDRLLDAHAAALGISR